MRRGSCSVRSSFKAYCRWQRPARHHLTRCWMGTRVSSSLVSICSLVFRLLSSLVKTPRPVKTADTDAPASPHEPASAGFSPDTPYDQPDTRERSAVAAWLHCHTRPDIVVLSITATPDPTPQGRRISARLSLRSEERQRRSCCRHSHTPKPPCHCHCQGSTSRPGGIASHTFPLPNPSSLSSPQAPP